MTMVWRTRSKTEKSHERTNGVMDDLDVGTVIGNAKNHYAQTWHQNNLTAGK